LEASTVVIPTTVTSKRLLRSSAWVLHTPIELLTKEVITVSTRNERHVAPHPDGWQVTKPGASRPSAVTHTQAEAIGRAREILGNDRGGEVVIHGRDGRIRDSDTVAPGNDPFPPRDKK
jgi:hypothetical protein